MSFCSCCGDSCGVDEYEYRKETLCADCLKTLEKEGVVVGMCVWCGDVLDDDMPVLKNRGGEIECEKCHRSGASAPRPGEGRMVLTEKEANGKHCIQAMTVDALVFCLASRCMAWRWSDPATKHKITIGREEKAEILGKELWQVEADTREVPFPDRRGFCGLAGRPEGV